MKRCMTPVSYLSIPKRNSVPIPSSVKGGGKFCSTYGLKRKTKPHPLRHSHSKRSGKKLCPMEKLALSLVHMTRRLNWYFEAHPVKVITDQPIKQILSKTEASGKLAKYAVELGAYNITFEPRNAVKGQVLADFITETSDGELPKKYFRMPKVAHERDDTEEWMLFTDGASSLKGSCAGLVLIGPSGVEHTYALHLTFDNFNNEVEYKALLAGLRITRGMDIQKLEARVDSKLVAS
ncbi:reverse transcriptase domain-containing protein [Tanacetum coccineum]|uniref:Reverse transcriptase domain-containing protein n=1 Tax=Tanacetum coccineum TaxID=301880 RepID=A0ABQ5GHF4_9ASTR